MQKIAFFQNRKTGLLDCCSQREKGSRNNYIFVLLKNECKIEFKSQPEAFQRWVVITTISIKSFKKKIITQNPGHFHLEVITELDLIMNSIPL